MPSIITSLFICIILYVIQGNGRINKRIMGGITTDIVLPPYIVSLQYKNKHECGAAIIRPAYILTAAHCIESKKMRSYTVRAGSMNHKKGGVIKNVKNVIIHPYYKPATSEYDIALLELEDPLPLTKRIIAVPLADNEPQAGEQILVTGWGALREKHPNVKDLQSVNLYVVSREKCQIALPNEVITKTKICAGYEKGGKDACQGDSGGPAVWDGKLVGIVSWGEGCGRKGIPGTYTNVVYFKTWITALMP